MLRDEAVEMPHWWTPEHREAWLTRGDRRIVFRGYDNRIDLLHVTADIETGKEIAA